MFIIKHKKIFIGISAFFVALSIVFIGVFGLNLGIDFKGGALYEISYTDARPDIETLSEKVNALELGNVLIQPAGEKDYLIKSKNLTEEERVALFNSFSIDGKYEVEEKSFNSIGPSVGKELQRKALISIVLVILSIILFIAFAFRKVSKPVSSWKYGLIAIVSLLHDVIIPTGIFAIMGHYAGAEADMLLIVAILTILGLSVNDTIVVFDRIRENINKEVSEDFAETVGISIEQTFARSINTSLTVIMALLALFFFGPETTKYFALMLTAGMFFGTYSSIFLASPLLVLADEWQKGSK